MSPLEELRLAVIGDEYEAIPLLARIKEVSRQNDKRPALLECIVPDQWVKNLKGEADRVGAFWLIRVPASKDRAKGVESSETGKEPAESAATEAVET